MNGVYVELPSIEKFYQLHCFFRVICSKTLFFILKKLMTVEWKILLCGNYKNISSGMVKEINSCRMHNKIIYIIYLLCIYLSFYICISFYYYHEISLLLSYMFTRIKNM